MEQNKKKELLRGLKFFLFSISAGIIQIGSFTVINLLLSSNQEYGVAYFISLLLSVLWNFTFNRKFTFQAANNIALAMTLVFAFYAVFTPLSVWWGVALEKKGWDDFLILAMTMAINLVTEFFYTRYVVYRNSIDTAKKNSSDPAEK